MLYYLKAVPHLHPAFVAEKRGADLSPVVRTGYREQLTRSGIKSTQAAVRQQPEITQAAYECLETHRAGARGSEHA